MTEKPPSDGDDACEPAESVDDEEDSQEQQSPEPETERKDKTEKKSGRMSNSFLQKGYLGPPPGLGSVLVTRPRRNDADDLHLGKKFSLKLKSRRNMFPGFTEPSTSTTRRRRCTECSDCAVF